MRKVILAGGSGYVGSVIRRDLFDYDGEVETWDLGVYPSAVEPDRKVDLREVEPPDDGSIVVWLASIHEMSMRSPQAWRDYAYCLSCALPFKWAYRHPMIYISSARAVNGDPFVSLYTEVKLQGEQRLRNSSSAHRHLILRPGTCWGPGVPGCPQRLHTVPNAFLRGEPIPPGWSAPITKVDAVADAVVRAIYELDRGKSFGNQVLNLFGKPLSAAELETYLTSVASESEIAQLRSVEKGEHPTQILRRRLGLPEPVFDA